MTPLILHAYDASPFTQRVLRMLGLKGLGWRWVETPMLPPKVALSAMTAGYRGTPVLQIGRELYIDSQRIALELDRRHPAQPLLLTALGPAWLPWSDSLFRSALGIVLAQQAHTWPPAFRDDRRALFPHIDFDQAPADRAHHELQLGACLALLESHLGSADFLEGPQAGLADVNLQPFLAMLLGCAESLVRDFPRVRAWESRIASLGEGKRQRIDPDVAQQTAASAGALAPVGHVWRGVIPSHTQVSVTPLDNRRGVMRGRLVISDLTEIGIEHEWAGVGTVRVHLPRTGYRVEAG